MIKINFIAIICGVVLCGCNGSHVSPEQYPEVSFKNEHGEINSKPYSSRETSTRSTRVVEHTRHSPYEDLKRDRKPVFVERSSDRNSFSLGSW